MVHLSKFAGFHQGINENLFNGVYPLQILQKYIYVYLKSRTFYINTGATALFSPSDLCPLGTLMLDLV